MIEEDNKEPYPGPRPFREDEKKKFFGRSREIDEITSLLFAHRVIFLYSQSGAGKTSLLNAGLLPAFQTEHFDVLPVARVGAPMPEGLKLGDNNNVFVFNTLLSWAAAAVQPAALFKHSISDSISARPLKEDEQESVSPQVIVFDQFEEMFTTYTERWKQREEFFQQIAQALKNNPYLRVMFLLREEYIAHLDSYANVLPERPAVRYRLKRLNKEAALLAIKQPLTDTGRSIGDEVAVTLVNNLLKVQKPAGGEPYLEDPDQQSDEREYEYIEPVQLQIVCKNIWDDLPVEDNEITQKHLQEFGDVNEALADYYVKSIEKVAAKKWSKDGQEYNVKEGELRNWFEHSLITPAGTRGMVYMGAEKTEGIANEAVEEFEKLYLVRREPRAGAEWYELTHDRFIQPILQSNKRWRSQRSGEIHEKLEKRAALFSSSPGKTGLLDKGELEKAEHWLTSAEAAELGYSGNLVALVRTSRAEIDRQILAEKARTYRRLWRLAIALGIMLLASFALVGYARHQQSIAKEASQEALAQREEAQNQRREAETQRDLAYQRSIKIGEINKELEEAVKKLGDANTKLEGEGKKLKTANDDLTKTGDQLQAKNDELTRIAKEKDELLERYNATIADLKAANAERKTLNAILEKQNEELQAAKTEAEVNSKIAFSRELAAKSRQDAEEDDPVPSVWASLYSVSELLKTDTNDTTLKDSLLTLEKVLPGALFRLHPMLHFDHIIDQRFGKDKTSLFATDEKGLVTTWNTVTGDNVSDNRIKIDADLSFAAITPDGKTLILNKKSTKEKPHVEFWDLASGVRKSKKQAHKRGVYKIALSDDGRYLATSSTFGNYAIVDLTAKKNSDPNSPKLHSEWERPSILTKISVRILRKSTFRLATAFAFSHRKDNKLVAVGFQDGKVEIYDVNTGHKYSTVSTTAPQLNVNAHNDTILKMAFSTDDRTLVTSGRDNSVKVWSVVITPDKKAGNTVQFKEDLGQYFRNAVTSIAFSPDGRLMAIGGEDRNVSLWDVKNLQKKIDLPIHKDLIDSVAFSPNGKMLFTSSGDKIKAWDVSSIDNVQELRRNIGEIIEKAESGDRSQAATAKDRKVFDLLSNVETLLGRPLDHLKCGNYFHGQPCPKLPKPPSP